MTTAAPAADTFTASRTWPLAGVPWLLAWCVLVPLGAAIFADPDLWGHLRFGLDTLARHRLDAIDPYSFTQDVSWVNHEWLSEVVMAAAYSAGGNIGLAALKLALVLATYAVVASALAGSWPVAAIGLELTFAIATLPQTVTLRPQLWTLLFTAVLCRVLTTPPSRWWLAGLPLLFLIWANMHGGWLIGAAILVLWTAAQMFNKSGTRRLLIVAAGVLSALATLANPYGSGLWVFLAKTVRPARNITEWQPLSTAPLALWGPYAILLCIVLALLATKDRPRWESVLILGVLGYGALRVTRIAALWAVAAAVFVAPTVRAWSARIPERWWTFRVASREGRWIMTAPVVCAAVVAAIQTVQLSRCIKIKGEWTPDLQAARALADAHPSGRLVTIFDWGEFAIWQYGPALRVSVDGRRETVYSDRLLEQHDEMLAATPAGLGLLKRFDPSYVWAPNSRSALRAWLAGHGYRLDVQTAESYIAVRNDLAALGPAADAASGLACFPGL